MTASTRAHWSSSDEQFLHYFLTPYSSMPKSRYALAPDPRSGGLPSLSCLSPVIRGGWPPPGLLQLVADFLPGLGVLAESFLQGAPYDLYLHGCFQLPTAGVFSCIHNNVLLTECLFRGRLVYFNLLTTQWGSYYGYRNSKVSGEARVKTQ